MNITCSALPEQLLESELFGHERGAFTDRADAEAAAARDGRRRDGVPRRDRRDDPALQAKLLRFLEEKKLQACRRRRRHSRRRAGRSPPPTVTSKMPSASRQFRSDLYYRLNVLPMTMPSLRSHAEDVPLLVEYLHRRFQQRVPQEGAGGDPGGVHRAPAGYGWPGNVRELRNVIERAMLLSDHDRLDVADFAALSRSVAASDDFELAGQGCRPREAGAQPGRSRR